MLKRYYPFEPPSPLIWPHISIPPAVAVADVLVLCRVRPFVQYYHMTSATCWSWSRPRPQPRPRPQIPIAMITTTLAAATLATAICPGHVINYCKTRQRQRLWPYFSYGGHMHNKSHVHSLDHNHDHVHSHVHEDNKNGPTTTIRRPHQQP